MRLFTFPVVQVNPLTSSSPQHRTNKPSLSLADVFDTPVPHPFPLDTVDVSLPYPLHLQPDTRQPLLPEEPPHTRPPRVEAPDDPAPRPPARREEPVDRPQQVVVLPRHPEAVARQDPVEGAAVPPGKRRGQVAPRVARDLDGRGAPGGPRRRGPGPQVPARVLAEVGDHRGRGVVGDDDAPRAEEGREQRGKGGAGAKLEDGEVGDVEILEGRAQGGVDEGVRRCRGGESGRLGGEGAGLEELGEEEGGVPQEVAEEFYLVVTLGVGESEM